MGVKIKGLDGTAIVSSDKGGAYRRDEAIDKILDRLAGASKQVHYYDTLVAGQKVSVPDTPTTPDIHVYWYNKKGQTVTITVPSSIVDMGKGEIVKYLENNGIGGKKHIALAASTFDIWKNQGNMWRNYPKGAAKSVP